MLTSREFQDRLLKRAKACGLDFSPSLGQSLEIFYRALERWNARMNLTALALEDLPEETADRLILEPVAASSFLGRGPIRWFDLGSGGGSPAVPLKLCRPEARLIMVESKGRKAAFLREAVRTLTLQSAVVENCRFEDLETIEDLKGAAEYVTVRAVRPDAAMFQTASCLLQPGGQLLVFGSPDQPEPDEAVASVHFKKPQRYALSRVPKAMLTQYTAKG